MIRLFTGLMFAASLLFAPQMQADTNHGVEVQGVYAQTAQPLSGAPDFHTFAGHMTLIVTFQPDCPWCKIQFDDLAAFHAEDAPWLQVAAVSLRGNRRDLVHELRQARTEFSAYRSSQGLLDALHFTPGTPCVYLVSPDGELIGFRRGRQTREQLREMLSELAER